MEVLGVKHVLTVYVLSSFGVETTPLDGKLDPPLYYYHSDVQWYHFINKLSEYLTCTPISLELGGKSKMAG